MKRILLVSLWGNRNYGNKLQSYALCRILKKLDCSVVVAEHNEPKDLKWRVKSILDLLLPFGNNWHYNQLKRWIRFCRFNREYIKESVYVKNFKIKGSLINDIDFGITGSDQVWHNWFGLSEELEYYYLRFLPKEKRIAFATSFGYNSIPEKDRELHSRCINEMHAVSVREESAKNLAVMLGREDVITVVDPTLCLSKEEWEEIAKVPKRTPKDGYILVFFLGSITEEYMAFINRLASKKDVQILNINNPESPLFSCDPGELIWLVKRAEYICTDSFHITAFSILFGKQFWVFHRVGEGFTCMFDRINTLLSVTELSSREYTKDKTESLIENQIDDEKYERIQAILDEEKRKSISFLIEALK